VTTQADAHRIEITASTSHVIVRRDGVVLADSKRPVLLKEGKLPTRFYLPKGDLCIELEPTQTKSHCPFKGDASYWSAKVNGDVATDIAWSYETPIPVAEAIAGLVCFYNEKVDLEVDGELLERPRTRWS
jgi:uncharacterized protein (DUF427 family)